ncbi:hypothetical protein TCAL_16662 [Tigriopus californicus]|uniref:Uncharacterized protein n=1 Tax=Tigriopus californicus TaxID=6832 RepID=A0A553NDL9_TIGCA|nr:hypothetical protein TCAL_16662 [Tigriopus californicus]
MIPIICQPWPEDAMLRACDVILEQTNLERDRKRTIYPGFKAIHDHFGLMVQNQSLGKSPGLTTSPKLFVRCLQLFANKLESLSAEATQKEHSHKQAQKKYDQIGKQCQAMSDEIKILGESLRELESKLAEFNQKRQEANNLLEEYNEKKKKVSLLKVTELSNVAKGLRTPNEPLKLLASALCILFDDQPNAYAAKDGNILHRKVKDAREQTKPDEADPWTVGKKILSDLSLIDKLTSHVDMETHSVQIELVANLILSDPSWDPTSFAKGPFYSGEPIALLMEAWCKLYRRQQV